MINHGRTLLLNQSGRTYQPQYLGEEYIPPLYGEIDLPSYLRTARRLIFGADPERVFLNFRTRELLHTIHETGLAEYLYDLDPRVTYWPEQNPVFFNNKKRVTAAQIAGPSNARLYFSGNFAADNVKGIAQRDYTVRAIGGTMSQVLEFTAKPPRNMSRMAMTDAPNNYIVIEYDDDKFDTTITPVDVSTGLSSAVDINGTDLSVRVGGVIVSTVNLMMEDGYELLTEALDSISAEQPEVAPDPLEFRMAITTPQEQSAVFTESAWRVSAFANPTSVINVVPLLEVMGEPNLLELFGVSNYDQPYATFKNMWFDHPLAPYRLAGFTMAMIYRTEEIRRGVNV